MEQTDKGKRFEELAKKRGAKAAIVKLTETDYQTVNNWRYRGVPAQQALIVAGYLSCSPDEISVIDLGQSWNTPAPALKLSPQLQAIVAATESFDWPKTIELIQAAGHIAAGRRLAIELETKAPASGADRTIEDSTNQLITGIAQKIEGDPKVAMDKNKAADKDVKPKKTTAKT